MQTTLSVKGSDEMAKILKKIRVACYVRVSTDEQAKNGLSVETQIARLKEYVAKQENYSIVDFYIDNGVSSVKIHKRLALQRLLDDVRNGEIDLILFTDLDRWGRDVKLYHQIQDVLDMHGVKWNSITEDYDTTSADGKLRVNILMSVAQHERDKDSERIKVVFENKIKNGEALYGDNATPFGFMIREVDGKKRMVHNPQEEPILKALIDYYYTWHSKRKAMVYVQENYGIHLLYESISKLLSNTLLYGSYRGNDNYVEPYITKEKWDEIQEISRRNIRVRKTRNTYMFSAMIVCPCCGSKLVGFSSVYTDKNGSTYKRLNYKCDRYYTRFTCSFKKTKSELKFEKELMANLKTFMHDYIIDCEMQEKTTPKKKVNVDAIKAEMDRLNNMYLKGRIDEDVYDEKYKELSDKIKKAEAENTQKKASEKVKDIMGINLSELYQTFTQEEKQAFWSGLIRSIHIDENYNILKIDFF